jgi:hypothetical protein
VHRTHRFEEQTERWLRDRLNRGLEFVRGPKRSEEVKRGRFTYLGGRERFVCARQLDIG